MREHNIPPSVIKTDKEAEELTTADPFGKKWKVGDEYYPATKLGVDFAIPEFTGCAAVRWNDLLGRFISY